MQKYKKKGKTAFQETRFFYMCNFFLTFAAIFVHRMEQLSDRELKSRLGLEETRLNHIGENIRRVIRLKDALLQYGEVYAQYSSLLEQLKELRRKEASLAPEAAQMKRYESIESITTPVVRLSLMREDTKESMLLSHQTITTGKALDRFVVEVRKQIAQNLSGIENRVKSMEDAVDILCASRHREGALEVLEQNIANLENLADQITQHRTENQQIVRQLEEQTALKKKELDRMEKGPLMGHLDMLEKVSVVLTRLQRMQSLKQSRVQVGKKVDEVKVELEKETANLNQLREKTIVIDQQIQHQLEAINALRIDTTHEDSPVKKDRLSSLTKTMNNLGNERDELLRRIAGLNVAYEVHLDQLDHFKAEQKEMEEAYLMLYEQLQNIISLHDWYTTFEKDPSAVIQRIETMKLDWESHKERVAEMAHNIDVLEAKLSDRKEELHWQEERAERLSEQIINMNHLRQQLRQDLTGVTPDGSRPEDFYGKKKEAFTQELDTLQGYIDSYQDKCREAQKSAGRVEAIHEIDEARKKRMEQMQNQVDLWLHQYCADHAPLQYVQLEDILTGDHPWSKHRDEVLRTRMDVASMEVRVEELRKQLERLEGETGALRPEELSSLTVKADMELENLIKEQKETAIKLARLELHIKMSS